MVTPFLLPLFAGLGAAKIGQGFLGMRERRKALSEQIAGLEEQQSLIEPTRAQMEGGFQRQEALLPQQMAARGLSGGTIASTYKDRLSQAHALAQQRLNTRANALARALSSARRQKRLGMFSDILGIGTTAASVAGGISEILDQPSPRAGAGAGGPSPRLSPNIGSLGRGSLWGWGV